MSDSYFANYDPLCVWGWIIREDMIISWSFLVGDFG